ncbi:hypothetical protein E2C01_089220 [Portunus trituberculatus]|uniref:Uncharacterized protein n=1 Tax=Portunus trituberculatus TaxID=210409 RepID=A0A5B7JLU7_PORTR|nr:hypothetical protein [Portunus trituberculatus]
MTNDAWLGGKSAHENIEGGAKYRAAAATGRECRENKSARAARLILGVSGSPKVSRKMATNY